MAGLCTLSVHPRSAEGKPCPAIFQETILITDGPTVIAPGTLSSEELQPLSGFELRLKDQVIGYLSLLPAPTARFDGEGSFHAPQEYIWSSSAEHELKERMGKLVGDAE